MNKAEIKLLLKHLEVSYTDELTAVRFVINYFKIKEILISKGSKGASYYDDVNECFVLLSY